MLSVCLPPRTLLRATNRRYEFEALLVFTVLQRIKHRVCKSNIYCGSFLREVHLSIITYFHNLYNNCSRQCLHIYENMRMAGSLLHMRTQSIVLQIRTKILLSEMGRLQILASIIFEMIYLLCNLPMYMCNQTGKTVSNIAITSVEIH